MPRGSLPQHGHSCRNGKSARTSEYSAWGEMKARCLRKTHSAYNRYGGRGLTIYEPWITSFPSFLEYMGSKPEPRKRHSLDRIDNNGNYEPGNVRWATYEQQNNNRRKQSKVGENFYEQANCVICDKRYMKRISRPRHLYCSNKCACRIGSLRRKSA